MNLENPEISIIIPCFNRELLIKQTLDSLLSQTYRNFEALIVDDGSDDNSASIVHGYTIKDKRIKSITRNRPPKGAPTCRNIGTENAKGKYLIYLDSDDLLAPFCLERRVDFMEKRPDLDFAVFPGLRFKEKPYDTDLLISAPVKGDLLPYFLSLEIPWITLNAIWKKESLISKGLKWSEEIKSYQDIQFHIDSICSGLSYELSDSEPDCFWREHPHGNIGKNLLHPTLTQSHISLHSHLYDSLVKSNNNSKNNIKRLNSFLFKYFKNYCSADKIDSAETILNYLCTGNFISRIHRLIFFIFIGSKKLNQLTKLNRLYVKFIYVFYNLFIWPRIIVEENNKIFLSNSYK